MAYVTPLYDHISSEPYLLETRTNRMLRRVVGALAWPYGETDGCALVLGEIRTPQAMVGGRHELFVLAEGQTADAQELVRLAAVLQSLWLVRRWSTPLYDTRIYLIDDYNDELRRRRESRSRIVIGDPPGWSGKGEGLIPMYHAFIRRRTVSEKTLHFGRESMAAEEIRRMGEANIKTPVTHFPSAAAAFWAVASIDFEPMPEWGERTKGRGGPADLVGGY
jgi:hypothetical protein